MPYLAGSFDLLQVPWIQPSIVRRPVTGTGRKDSLLPKYSQLVKNKGYFPTFYDTPHVREELSTVKRCK